MVVFPWKPFGITHVGPSNQQLEHGALPEQAPTELLGAHALVAVDFHGATCTLWLHPGRGWTELQQWLCSCRRVCKKYPVGCGLVVQGFWSWD